MKADYVNLHLKIDKLNNLADRVYYFSVKNYNTGYIIMCEGNILSNCLILAEAPGSLEESMKRILVGKSGTIIRNILQKYGIESNVFFLNVIPWRPYNNNTPTVSQIKAYLPFWKELFSILKIDNIICLGSIAKKLLHYSDNNFNALNIYYTWHPAYYLRTNNKKHLDHIDMSILYAKSDIVCCNINCYLYFVRTY